MADRSLKVDDRADWLPAGIFGCLVRIVFSLPIKIFVRRAYDISFVDDFFSFFLSILKSSFDVVKSLTLITNDFLELFLKVIFSSSMHISDSFRLVDVSFEDGSLFEHVLMREVYA